MCLTTTYKKGFISSEDIVVFKKLERSGCIWKTPCQSWEVTLDSELIPDQKSPDISEGSHNVQINGGVIHAYLQTRNYSEEDCYFKAIIPKGTRFWIQDDLSEIASEKLYLTSERVYNKRVTDLSFLFRSSLDLLTKDGKRIPWSPEIDKKDIRGIFVYDDQAIGLDIFETNFSSGILNEIPNTIKSGKEALKDMSGYERTRILREKYPDIKILKDLPKDSYIPSLGELSKALENFLFINITRQALGLEPIGYNWFWSSTPYSDCHGWYVHPDYRGWFDWRYYSWRGGIVLPFFALTK